MMSFIVNALSQEPAVVLRTLLGVYTILFENPASVMGFQGVPREPLH